MTWSEENNARMDAAQTRVIVLRERVIDEHVRTTFRDTTDLRSQLLMSSSAAEALEGYQLIADGVDESIEAAGQTIRRLAAD